MDEQATGLILRTRPLTETSLIVHWLTQDAGRLATVAKGARRARSPFGGKLDLLFLADFSFQRRRNSDLHLLREVNVRNYQSNLRRDIHALRRCSYFVQLVELGTETETPIPSIFELMVEATSAALEPKHGPAVVLAFEVKLLGELGMPPTEASGELTPGSREILARMLSSDFDVLSRMKLSASQAGEIPAFLHRFLAFHLGKIPGGRIGALA